MSGDRVQSKNLFNFTLTGEVDPDIIELERTAMETMGVDVVAMMEQMQEMPAEEYAKAVNGMMQGMCQAVFNAPTFVEAINDCNHTDLSVPTSHDGPYDVQVLIHTPKTLSEETNRACIIYAHGGGAIAGEAAMHKGLLSHMAVSCGLVVFNVDYRLAPATRCPNNILDFYEAIKYVSSNAASLGVDPDRIAIAGESGGGYICAGAMVQLANMEESHLVKLAVPIIPMLSDYCFSDMRAMTREEQEQAIGQRKIWSLLAGPKLEEMSGDPMLYPGKADEETLKKMPPCIIWESEFDLYITEATRFAHRLRTAGRLLELVVIPGAKHGSGMMPHHECFNRERKAWKLAMQEYLIN